MLRKGFIIFMVIFCLLGLNSLVFAEEPQQKQDENLKRLERYLKIWAGYNWYKMGDFNNKLRSEGNETIDGGVNVGIEVNMVDLPIPKLFISIKTPLGIEYLGASSKTTHTGAGGFATVNWELPVVGVYIAPEISFFEKSTWLYLRPIGVGYYNLGDIADAKLTVTDRPGRLEVSGNSVGILSQIGMKYSKNTFTIFVEGGYRLLKFTDVSQQPKDGFTVTPSGPLVQPGNLPQTLDYSGFIVKAGVGIQF